MAHPAEHDLHKLHPAIPEMVCLHGLLLLLQVSRDTTAVSFFDLWGLWVVLGGSMVVGALLMLVQRTLRRREHHRLLQVGGPVQIIWIALLYIQSF